MNAKQLNMVAKKLVKWDELSFPSNDEEILTIVLDYPYYIVVKYGAVTLHEVITNEDEGIYGEERSIAIAVVDWQDTFNCYKVLDFAQLKIMYDVLAEYQKVKLEMGLTD